jgi:hypothetical protein
VSEDIKFPHAVVVNRNLIAMLMDKLVESGALSPEASEAIIEQALSMEPTPEMLNMSTTETFVRDVFTQADALGLTGPPAPAPAPVKPVCPQCGADIKPGQKFCTGCGYKLI